MDFGEPGLLALLELRDLGCIMRSLKNIRPNGGWI